MLVREMAWALARHGIRVNAVRPGWINLAGSAATETELARSTSWVPLGRGGTPEAVADTGKSLVSDKASYVTGSIVDVDGGLGLHSWRIDEWMQDES